MKISQGVAWVGDSSRIALLRVDVLSRPLILSGVGAELWMRLVEGKTPKGAESQELIDQLVDLGLLVS